MIKNKNIKKSLIGSILSLILCLAMLIGSTFAWFTDNVVSDMNRIVAGNLDIELEYKDTNGDWQPIDVNQSLFKSADETLWEPGHTEYVQLRIRNVGSLALMYKLNASAYSDINGTEEKQYVGKNKNKFKLSDFLVFNKTQGANTVTNREDLWINDRPQEEALMGKLGLEALNMRSDKLLPNDTHEMTLAIYMPTWVDNEANQDSEDKKTQGAPTIYFGLNLFATQTSHEEDSFSDDYDIAADPDYDPFAKADAEALEQGYAYRNENGTYGGIINENTFLLDNAKNARNSILIKNIGTAQGSVNTGQANYTNKNSTLDLNGHTYTFGGLELRQSSSGTSTNSSIMIKNGTMIGSVTSSDLLKSNNAMQNVTLDNITAKWNIPRPWDENKNNYFGINFRSNILNTVYTINNSTLDCNASFSTNSLPRDNTEVAQANLTNTTINGRLHAAGLTMNMDHCIVNGEVHCNASDSSKTVVNINNSTINGNAFFDANTTASYPSNDVRIENTVINGNLQTKFSRNNVKFTLIDTTITGTINYSDFPNKLFPASKVTIVSGTYSFDPTKYLAEGSSATYDEASNVWVVNKNN